MTSDEVTSENHWQITSRVTKKSLFTVTNVLFYFLHAISCPEHRAVSGEGITYYPRQNGGDWKADSDGFESNCPVSTVHELAIVTHVISNNATTCMET